MTMHLEQSLILHVRDAELVEMLNDLRDTTVSLESLKCSCLLWSGICISAKQHRHLCPSILKGVITLVRNFISKYSLILFLSSLADEADLEGESMRWRRMDGVDSRVRMPVQAPCILGGEGAAQSPPSSWRTDLIPLAPQASVSFTISNCPCHLHWKKSAYSFLQANAKGLVCVSSHSGVLSMAAFQGRQQLVHQHQAELVDMIAP